MISWCSTPGDVADETIADCIHTIENIGQKQHDAYVRERLIDQVRPISDPIKRKTFSYLQQPHAV